MHTDETRLNDYLDDVLDDAEAERVTEHLAVCSDCAAELAQLRALKSQLGQLPHEIMPARDLRPGIWQQIDQDSITDITPMRRSALWSARYRLAAAAVILIITSSAVTVAILREQGALTPMAQEHARDNTVLVARDAQVLEREFSDEVRELETIVRKSRGALAPETIRILEHNLRIIDGAIREAKAAMKADPNSDMLIEMLRAAYQRKLELLRTAAKSSALT